MKLHQDHITVSERLEHDRFEQLREFDHRPEYVDVRVVPSESSDTAYLVARVECLAEPFDPATTDVSADRREIHLCSCPQFHFRCSGGFEDGENPPAEWGECKHIMANP
jgi:hypothetical protein